MTAVIFCIGNLSSSFNLICQFFIVLDLLIGTYICFPRIAHGMQPCLLRGAHIVNSTAA
jgi:hypothetical protein